MQSVYEKQPGPGRAIVFPAARSLAYAVEEWEGLKRNSITKFVDAESPYAFKTYIMERFFFL